MTEKLTIYNGALAHLEQRKLASLSEGREPKRVLDDLWDKEVAWCLERHFWNFAYRSIELQYSASVTPTFGYAYAFQKPSDCIRTRKLSTSPTFLPPLLRFAEEAGFWYADEATLYIQFNSNHAQYGMDLGKWPASFADFVEHRLARKGCKRITGSDDLLQGAHGLIKQEEKARRNAAAICAMNEPVGFAPRGSWVNSRTGFGIGRPGGDVPGDSLIG